MGIPVHYGCTYMQLVSSTPEPSVVTEICASIIEMYQIDSGWKKNISFLSTSLSITQQTFLWITHNQY